MNILSICKYIVDHPLNKGRRLAALYRFFHWQVKSRLSAGPHIIPFTSRSKLSIEKGMTGATGNLYCGLHEFADMAFLLHFLREGDVFADVGANVGSYTVLSSAHCKARTISFEPLLHTYQKLLRNIEVNNIESIVIAENTALGEKSGELAFTKGLDTANHVAKEGETNTVTVPVKALDVVLEHHGLKPILLKIDVEGFETEVFKGAGRTLNSPELKAIIIELNGSGERYGFDEKKLHEELISLRYKPYSYEPFDRNLNPLESYGVHNTIYIKDPDFVKSRIKEAESVTIRNHTF